MIFILAPLPYAFTALEPYLDAKTLEIHYTKHHQAYVNNLNEALKKHPELEKKTLRELITDLKAVPEDIRESVRNNGGGHFNHTLFWDTMCAGGSKLASGKLSQAIDASFGSFEAFQQKFTEIAKKHFASGWTFLVTDPKGKLSIVDTPNHDTPLAQGLEPLLVIDVWEHAYYLKFQNRRPEFVEAWWHVVNWSFVEQQYEHFLTKHN